MSKTKLFFWRWLYKAHRYMGLLSAVVLFMLAVTGIALNHTKSLKLDSRFVHNQMLLNRYGIVAPNPQQVFKSTHYYLSQLDQKIYLNQQFILSSVELLQGIVETEDFIVIALQNSMILLSLDGQIIEQIEKLGLEKIGLNTNQNIVISQSGKTLLTKDGLLSWHETKPTPVQWSQSTKLPLSMVNIIKQNFRSTMIPLERVVLDLHSGRFFGNIGVFIVDACGILLILLIFSGSSIWLKHWLRKLLR